MKSGLPAAAALLLVAAAGIWAWMSFSPKPQNVMQQSRPARASHPAAVAPQTPPPKPVDGRVMLTPQQIAEARGAGTLDRPIVSLLKVDAPMSFGDYVWNDQAVPPGPTWIRIDLRSQLISVFRAGQEIGTSVIVYGGDNKETPRGLLHILGKSKDHRSSIYDAPMPYTLRLTGDGVSIHGSNVRYGAATHGCIGVPPDFARKLFGVASVGDEVVIVSTPRQTS